MTIHALRTRVLLFATVAVVLPTGTGCSWFRGKPEATPPKVTSSAFYQPAVEPLPTQTPTTGPAVVPAVTPAEPPVVAAGSERAAPPTQTLPRLTDTPAPTPAVVTPAPVAPAPGTPQRQPAPASLGTYMTIGGVLAEVNGIPIFAARVMRELETVLATRARELDERSFEREARNLITRQVQEFVSEELEYASAQRNLDADDKKLADALTTDWRQKRIVEAGGSLEQAKRASLESSGTDFDQAVKTRNRLFLIQIYYQKKVFPRIQITTNDMRRFYRENVDRMFTERTEATFRALRVDPARVGGKAAALDKIKALRDRAAAGEDFAKMAASNVNDDPSLARNAGLIGPISRNSLALEKVEEAVFRTEAGQLTEIIEDRGGFYLAKIESRKTGSVRPFEEAAVQDKVREELRRLQVAQLRDQVRADLEKSAIVRRDPRMLQTALEMAAQRYPLWRAAPAPAAPGQ